MSTSEPRNDMDGLDLTRSDERARSVGASSLDTTDLALLARLANEFFSGSIAAPSALPASPGGPAPTSSAVGGVGASLDSAAQSFASHSPAAQHSSFSSPGPFESPFGNVLPDLERDLFAFVSPPNADEFEVDPDAAAQHSADAYPRSLGGDDRGPFGFSRALDALEALAWPATPPVGVAAQAPSATAANVSPDVSALSPQVVPDLSQGPRPFDPRDVRRDFPILAERVHGRPLIWLDNGATTQKPNAVIDRIAKFYRQENSNVHRGAHALAARSTDAYEGAREKVRRFLNASSTSEIVFLRGTTEAVNLVAQSYGRRHVRDGDEIVVTALEHHANIVPWQMLCAEVGARLRVAPVDDRGDVILEEYERLFNARTRFASIAHVSNALGTVNPVRAMVEIAHRHGVRILVDGAQAVSHMPVDLQSLGADFYAFSGHKLYGPTGIGVLYGRRDALELTPPWQGGGNMISDVTFQRTSYGSAPERYEAGTGSIADAVGLGAALDYLAQFGMAAVGKHEAELLDYLVERLRSVPGLRMLGSPRERAGAVSFVFDWIRSDEVGAALDKEGIAVRSGHHCAQPILRRFGVESSVRPSLGIYNSHDDVDALIAALGRIASSRG